MLKLLHAPYTVAWCMAAHNPHTRLALTNTASNSDWIPPIYIYISFFFIGRAESHLCGPESWAWGRVRGLLRPCVLCCVSLSTAGSAVGPRGSAGHTVRRRCLFAASNSPLLIGRATERTSRPAACVPGLTWTDDRSEEEAVSEGLVHWQGH